MNRKQLQNLISAGVFSAALLSGVAYADEAAANPEGMPTPAVEATTMPPTTAPAKPKAKKAKKVSSTAKPAEKQSQATGDKAAAKHECAGQNACAGQGGCATD